MVTASPVRTDHPGDWLRAGVAGALSELDAGDPDQATAHLLDLVLRDALALTAAMGDTCRYQPAAAAVRAARAALRCGEVARAREALASARATLG